MNTATFDCKTITPMFLTGAKGEPELRVPSIKGAMRFWWRAVRGIDDIKRLNKEENEIFGGTGETEGRSKIAIRVMYKDKELKDKRGSQLKDNYNLTWKFNPESRTLEGKDAGIGYLLYSTVFNSPTQYLKDGFPFSVKLSSPDIDSLKHAIASFWALVYLGGLGTRSRRGGGNMVVSKVSYQGEIDKIKEELPDFEIKGSNSDEVAEWIQDNLLKCQKMICGGRPKDFATRYSNLSFSRFIISNEGKNDWKYTLNDIGKEFKNFREEHRSDIFGSGAFGLPVRHKRMTVTCRVDRKDKDRRSSPLIIKTLRVNNSYYWLVLRLTGEFLPEGGVIHAPPSKQRPDYALIDEFWNILKEKDGKESILSMPEVIKKICAKIRRQSNPSKIILFGSRARGDAHKTADIDIAVENKDKTIYDDIHGPIDIVDIDRAPDNLKQRIFKEGVEL